VVTGAPAGSGFALYVTGYAVVRFATERLRGDPVRRMWRGLSEAQITSLIVTTGVATGGALGLLPGAAWHAVAAGAVAGGAILVLGGWLGPTARLLDAAHVREIGSALAALPPSRAGGPVPVARTSLGVRISCGAAADEAHYALSGPGIGDATAPSLAQAILWLRHRGREGEVVAGAAGVYHLLVHAGQ
jgi:hypothetical protein